MVNISFTRGDTYGIRFQRKAEIINEDKEIETKVIEEISQNMWFTVKKNFSDKAEVILQKTLEDGISFDEEFYYHIIINSTDTRDLKYGEYVYDIQVENNGVVKTIAKGYFILENEVTTDYV